jgi:6-phosphofructokinase 1
MDIKRIAVLTSGGDSPGMNCAIRSVVRFAHYKGIEVLGVIHGYKGLLSGEFIPLGPRDVSNIISRGGTILKAARCEEFYHKQGREKAYKNLISKNINGLIVIGGDGSFHGALLLYKEFGLPVVGIPGTIDNDINGTHRTLGFDTALNTAMSAIDKIKDTATSMDRIFLIEVMGRLSSAIAVFSALAGGAEDIIIPGEKLNLEKMIEKIEEGRRKGKKSWIIIVAEGAGKAEKFAEQFRKHISDVRVTVIGHLQRGGGPSAFDRILGALMGTAAVQALLEGKSHHAIGWRNDEIITYPLEEAVKPHKEKYSYYHQLIHILT